MGKPTVGHRCSLMALGAVVDRLSVRLMALAAVDIAVTLGMQVVFAAQVLGLLEQRLAVGGRHMAPAVQAELVLFDPMPSERLASKRDSRYGCPCALVPAME